MGVSPLNTLQLYFIRHGETEWSSSGQQEETRALLPWLRKIPLTAAFMSPRQRARTICDLAGLGRIAEIEPSLSEWDYGDYEGRWPDEIQQQQPGWSIFRDGCPNDETPTLFQTTPIDSSLVS